MSAETIKPMTEAEYLARERTARERSEFIGGDILAMAGGTGAHIRITGNVARKMGNQFEGKPCEAFSSEMKVKVSVIGDYVYPDVVAVCGEQHFTDESESTLLNPAVVIEVLSTSTEDYDRNEKAPLYRNLESLTDYVFIAQDRMSVEQYTRNEDGTWTARFLRERGDVLHLESVNVTLALAEIYDRVKLSGVRNASP